MQKKNQQQNNGFLIVASRTKSFYYSAINLIESIKDYYPEAQTCLVVDERLTDSRISVSDQVIFTERPNDYRAKLWGMAKTPFDTTLYVDADMECSHEDVATAFDLLGNNDMMFTALDERRDPCFKNRHFPAGSFEYNGGVCLYNSSKQRVRDFMHRWWILYTQQKHDKWWPIDPETGKWDLVSYGDRNDNKWWDQFTLWYLLNKDEEWSDIKVDTIPGDHRWNTYTNFGYVGLMDDPIFIHYSGGLKKENPEVYKNM